MARGDYPDDDALQDAWDRFCKQLRSAGEQVFKDYNPANGPQRADAFRFLTQNLGQAFDLALETRDTAYPQLHRFCTPNRKLGCDAADLSYQQAWIDGGHSYKVSGNAGTARFLNFTVQGARPDIQPGTGWPSLHEPFGDTPQANLFGHDLHTGADGSFELFIGGEQQGHNWLPTTAETRKLFIRQGFDDWDETPAQLTIERLDMDEPRPLPSPAQLREAMDWAGDFVTGLMRDWPDHPYQYSGGVVDPAYVNAFPPLRADSADDAKRGRLAAHLCWALQPDEVLVVEFDSHDGFWMASLSGAFMNSMDYLYRPVSATPARSHVDGDGKVRLVLAAADPGHPNWLDTQGFAAGNLTYRNLLGSQRTEFTTRLLPLAALGDCLPAGTPTVTPAQRTAELQRRFAAVRRRYGM